MMVPLNPGTQKKWLKIYSTYALGSLTEFQVAKKYHLTPRHIVNIIKWAVHYLNKKTDLNVQRQVLVDRLRTREQLLNKYIAKAPKDLQVKDIKDITLLSKELRTIDRLIAQAQGILAQGGVNIDKSDKRKITVITKDLHFREGASKTKPEPEEKKAINIDVDDDDDKKNKEEKK
jgi:hypothetical protein